MSVLWACRYALLTLVGVYALATLAGAVGVIAPGIAMLVGILSGWGIAVTALFCCAAQVGRYLSGDRQVKHG